MEKIMKFLSLTLLTILFINSCASNKSALMQVPVESTKIGKTNAKKFKHVYISGQPKLQDFMEAKKDGIKLVINLRTAKDKGHSKSKLKKEMKVITKAGIKYYNIPFSPCTASKKSFDKIEEVLKKHKGEKTLIHCSTGNRAAAWFASHMKNQHKVTTEQALLRAEQMGLNKKKMKKIIYEYLTAKTKVPLKYQACQDTK